MTYTGLVHSWSSCRVFLFLHSGEIGTSSFVHKGDMLLTGLLLMACCTCFPIALRTTIPKVTLSMQWTWPLHNSHQSRKCTTVLSIGRPVWWDHFLTEIVSSKNDSVSKMNCIKLINNYPLQPSSCSVCLFLFLTRICYLVFKKFLQVSDMSFSPLFGAAKFFSWFQSFLWTWFTGFFSHLEVFLFAFM